MSALKNRIGLVATAFAIACSSNTGPRSPSPGIRFVAGNNQADTVGATLTQGLVVNTVAHQPIEFQSVPDSIDKYGALVESLSSSSVQTYIADSTDGYGQASVVVAFGTVTGRARIAVSVPKLGFADTATFTVEPGAAVQIAGVLADTTVYSGVAIALEGIVVDRYGNPRPDPVTFHTLSGPATVSGNTVTTTAIGLARVTATAGPLADTTAISIVPHGRIATSHSPYIHIVNLDGSNSVSIAPNLGVVGNVRWAPDGQSIVYDQMFGCSITQIGDDSPIAIASLSGGANALQLPAFYYVYYPQYTRDGAHIYFTMLGASTSGQTWQADPKSGSTTAIGIPPNQDYGPSPSPDGSQLAYFHALSNTTADLRILTLSTGTVTDLGVPAYQPVWSPVSNQIAYIAAGTCQGLIHIINSDGSGDRALSANTYNSGFDWSPDGAWIVATNAGTGKIEVINVASGQVLPLTFSSGLGSPAWLPTARP